MAATIGARMEARSHEFMPCTLLDSQFAALEELEADEAHILADITQPLDVLVESLELKLQPEDAVTVEPKATFPTASQTA